MIAKTSISHTWTRPINVHEDWFSRIMCMVEIYMYEELLIAGFQINVLEQLHFL